MKHTLHNHQSTLPLLPAFLLAAYIATLPLRRLLHLPFVKAKVQFPELVFVFLLAISLPVCWRLSRQHGKWLAAAFAPYLLTLAVSAIRSGDVHSLLEVIGRGYLVVAALVFAAWVANYPNLMRRWLLPAYRAALLLLLATALIGYGSLLFGYSSRWVVEFRGFPYLGTVYRAASAAGSPTDTVLLATFPVMLEWRNWRTGRVGPWLLAVAVPLLLLTLSKDVVITLLGCWLVDPVFGFFGRGRRSKAKGEKRRADEHRYSQKFRWLAPALLLLLYLGWSHYLPERPKDYAPADLVGVNWTGGQVAYRSATFQLTETTYVATKRAALALLADEPWFGVGPDRMEVLVGSKVATGDYPANLPHFRPHSTWFGALAETGWLGFLALSWLVFALVRRAVSHFKSFPPSSDERVLIAFLLLILGASLIVETLHLRYIWVPIGILIGRIIPPPATVPH